MRVIRKINNSVALGLDSNGNEIIIMGKGIGFGEIPYELTDLSRVDRTFYHIDPRYYGLLTSIPENVFLLVTKLLDKAKQELKTELNPNLVFILADHVNFALQRKDKGMDILMPYSYELEYEYPAYTKVAKSFVISLNRQLHVHLDKGEITCILMHFLDAMEGTAAVQKNESKHAKISKVIAASTRIVEEYYHIHIDRDSFHYFRFKNHIKYFVQRKERGEVFDNHGTEDMFRGLIESKPDLYECVLKIDEFLQKEYGESCPHEELLYLMIHINQLHSKEDCDL